MKTKTRSFDYRLRPVEEASYANKKGLMIMERELLKTHGQQVSVNAEVLALKGFPLMRTN